MHPKYIQELRGHESIKITVWRFSLLQVSCILPFFGFLFILRFLKEFGKVCASLSHLLLRSSHLLLRFSTPVSNPKGNTSRDYGGDNAYDTCQHQNNFILHVCSLELSLAIAMQAPLPTTAAIYNTIVRIIANCIFSSVFSSGIPLAIAFV